ncbi:MAG: amino acid racemase [Bacteroidota bacterium]
MHALEMDIEKEVVIGIVGGMGPQAGATLFNYIMQHTDAGTDQEHLSVVLMSLPKHIADRTAFLEGKVAVNPAVHIAKIILDLEFLGAQVIGIACNTAHSPRIYNCIMEELYRNNSLVKLIHMPEATCHYLKENYKWVRRVGLMSSNGTYNSNIYKDTLQEMGFEVVLPDFLFQNDIIHRMIYDPKFGIKANTKGVTKQVHRLLEEALAFFKAQNTDAIILGCTELSMIKDEKQTDQILLIDSTEVLAKALIKESNVEIISPIPVLGVKGS